jgi:RND family efflux transporter MFP subunit
MKKIIYSLLVLTVLVSCQEAVVTSTAVLQSERDSLSTLQKDIAQRVKFIDAELAKQDSTKKLSSVSIMKLEPTKFKHYFKVYGVVESNQSIQLYAESSGKIKSIKVRHGENVVQGQLLAVIDGELIEKNIQEVKTALQLATKIYEKQSRLWLEENIGSEVQYLQAKHDKESWENKLATLNHQLAMTHLRAPFSGVIDHVFPKTGEMASPQMAMFRLVNLGNVYLTASVSEAYVGKITTGTPAKVHFKSLNQTIDSKVIRVGNYINPNNRTFDVNVALKSSSNFKPNMMGSVM